MTIHIRTLFDTPAHMRMTAEQYIDNPLSEKKSDLIEGVFVMASPASFVHEEIQVYLTTILTLFVDTKRLGKVLGPNAAYRLSDDNVFQPDISFIRAERLHLAADVYFPGPPDLAVEIVSPSSRQYDEVEKRINYGRFGTQEYWLLDPMDETVRFLGLADDQLLPIPPKEGVHSSRVLPGFWLRTEWIFPPKGQARPTVMEVAGRLGLLS